ncbi:GlxA family transcriptional regulator [Streptomyces buecherae]|uniref:Helix-turn-helix domain-containing protein n=1 Tax=Streptomyces buecherae TaxID=2763006 RepID=A0A7H8N874_9ACTN|nr:helix-turn-helix domain-containing protein [Streptomyces buecherae]QKW49968.1 helix-turn-helix domain-containing protein [Streptomyces buecherae]
MPVVALLLLDGVPAHQVTAAGIVFGSASPLAYRHAPYDLRLCSASDGPEGVPADVATGGPGSVRIAVDRGLDGLADAETVIVTGYAGFRAEPSAAVVEAVRAAAARGSRVGAIGTGVLLLAATGLLTGRRATTLSQHAAELARRHPRVTVAPEESLVADGPFLTSAGVFGGKELYVHVVARDHGEEAGVEADRHLFLALPAPTEPPRAAGPRATTGPPPTTGPRGRSAPDGVGRGTRGAEEAYGADAEAQGGQEAQGDQGAEGSHGARDAQHAQGDQGSEGAGEVEAVARWMATRLDRPLTLAEIANHAGMSVRSLNRRFRADTGLSPLQCLLRARIRRAQWLLERTDLPVGQIAAQTGLGTPANLRHHFQRHNGTTPGTYRAAYRSLAGMFAAAVGTETDGADPHEAGTDGADPHEAGTDGADPDGARVGRTDRTDRTDAEPAGTDGAAEAGEHVAPGGPCGSPDSP